jgi:hypothetical protein
MNDNYSRENSAERQRLIHLTSRLTEDDLNRPLPNGWTVASKLAHLAFWDRYYVSLIQIWERSGFAPSHANVDAINLSVRELSDAIPPMTVIVLVQNAADAIDRKVEAVKPELAAAIETAGYTRILCRAMHRREHLDQIEHALESSIE